MLLGCGCGSDGDPATDTSTPGGAGGSGGNGGSAAGGGSGGHSPAGAAGSGGAGAAGKATGGAPSAGSGGSGAAGEGGGSAAGSGGSGGSVAGSGGSAAGGGTNAGGEGGSGGVAGAGGSGGATQVTPFLRLIDISNPADLTSDGHYALLQDLESATGDIHRYDAATNTTEKLGDASNPDPAKGDTSKGTPIVPQPATRFSADTTRIVGTHGAPLSASVFSAGAWHDLGGLAGESPCPGEQGNLDDLGTTGAGWDISADGKTIVGMIWSGCGGGKAVRWAESGPIGVGAFTALEFSGKSLNRASRVSADGLVVGGFVDSDMADRTPAIWGADGKITVLDPTGVAIGEVLALSDDGTIAAGPWNDASGNGAFVWTSSGGVTMLPRLDTFQVFDQIFPNAVAQGGQLVFGASGDPSGNGSPMQAFVVTTKDKKARVLEDIVLAAGLTLPDNVHLANVIDASSDGTVLLGTTLDMDPSLPFPKQRSFYLRLPVSAYGL